MFGQAGAHRYYKLLGAVGLPLTVSMYQRMASYYVEPDIAGHSETVGEFCRSLKGVGRFVDPTYKWQTSEPQFQKMIEQYFTPVEGYFDQPKVGKLEESTEEKSKKSGVVTIRSCSEEETKEYSRSSQNAGVSVGGFPALCHAYLHSRLLKKAEGNNVSEPVVYVLPPDIMRSASTGNSGQVHASSAFPMYMGKKFGVERIVANTIGRSIFPLSQFASGNPMRHDYGVGEIYLPSLVDQKVWAVGLEYGLNQLTYFMDQYYGDKRTIVHNTVKMAVDSQKIWRNLTPELGDAFVQTGVLRVAVNEQETQEMRELASILKEEGVVCRLVSADEAHHLSNSHISVPEGGSVWETSADGLVAPDIIPRLVQGIQQNGGRVIEGYVDEILCGDDQTVFGVLVNGTDGQTHFLKASSVFCSLGAKARYECSSSELNAATVEPVISGTGYSAVILVDGPPIKEPIDINHTHCSPLFSFDEQGKTYTAVKVTAGGSIGVDGFCKDHALSSLHSVINCVYSDRTVEILAARSCTRSLNGINSVRVQEVLDGLRVVTGLGGKGITDAMALGLKVIEVYDKSIEPEVLKDFVNYLTSDTHLPSKVSDYPPKAPMAR